MRTNGRAKGTGMVLDYVLASKPEVVTACEIRHAWVSKGDHMPLAVDFKV